MDEDPHRRSVCSLGLLSHSLPALRKQQAGFYGSGELLSGLLAGMIAFLFRWLLFPARYLSRECEISLQLGGGVRAAPRCWQRGARGDGGSSDLQPGAAQPNLG